MSKRARVNRLNGILGGEGRPTKRQRIETREYAEETQERIKWIAMTTSKNLEYEMFDDEDVEGLKTKDYDDLLGLLNKEKGEEAPRPRQLRQRRPLM